MVSGESEWWGLKKYAQFTSAVVEKFLEFKICDDMIKNWVKLSKH